MVRGATLLVAVLVLIGGLGAAIGTAAGAPSSGVDSSAPDRADVSETTVLAAAETDTANADADRLTGFGVAVALVAIAIAALIERFTN